MMSDVIAGIPFKSSYRMKKLQKSDASAASRPLVVTCCTHAGQKQSSSDRQNEPTPNELPNELSKNKHILAFFYLQDSLLYIFEYFLYFAKFLGPFLNCQYLDQVGCCCILVSFYLHHIVSEKHCQKVENLLILSLVRGELYRVYCFEQLKKMAPQ
jgi:hypothetical protein